MFWKSFTDCLTGIYVALVHALAFMGTMTVYFYFFEPLELCRRVVSHTLFPMWR